MKNIPTNENTVRYEVSEQFKVFVGKEKVHRNKMSSSEPESKRKRKKKGGAEVKTELESWVNTGYKGFGLRQQIVLQLKSIRVNSWVIKVRKLSDKSKQSTKKE